MKSRSPRLLLIVPSGARIPVAKPGIPIAEAIPVENKRKVDIQTAIEELKKFRSRHRLGKLTIREMIEEGRRF